MTMSRPWTHGPWSPLQTLGRKTPLQRVQLEHKREENRTLLRFVRDASLRQRSRGVLCWVKIQNHRWLGRNL